MFIRLIISRARIRQSELRDQKYTLIHGNDFENPEASGDTDHHVIRVAVADYAYISNNKLRAAVIDVGAYYKGSSFEGDVQTVVLEGNQFFDEFTPGADAKSPTSGAIWVQPRARDVVVRNNVIEARTGRPSKSSRTPSKT